MAKWFDCRWTNGGRVPVRNTLFGDSCSTDNALYTFEQRLCQALEAEMPQDPKDLVGRIKNGVLEDFHHDGKLASLQFYVSLMKTIFNPLMRKLVIPAAKSIVEPLSEAIPDAFKQFIDPQAVP